MRLLHPSCLLAIALAGCGVATASWEKQGARLPQIDEDLQQCRVEARLSPEAHNSPAPRGTLGTPNMDRMEDRDAREAQLIQKCMLAKGYTPIR